MNLESVQPPINLIADLQALQLSIANDRGGDKTRQLFDFLKQSEEKCEEIRVRSTNFEEKAFAKMLNEAFAASSRIVLAAWHKAHDAELAV